MGSRGNPYDHSPTTPYNGNFAQASAYNRIKPFSMPHHNIARPQSSYEAYPQDNSSEFPQEEFEQYTHSYDRGASGSSVWITLFNLYNDGRITNNMYRSLTDLRPELYESNSLYITNLKNMNLITFDQYHFYMSAKYTSP
jgi:hypothetical protein